MADDAAALVPLADVYEVEGVFVVRIALPGVLEEDVDVSLGEASITVRGELERPVAADEGRALVAEWRYGFFERVIVLPARFDESLIRIEMDGGVLEIRLPKSAEAS